MAGCDLPVAVDRDALRGWTVRALAVIALLAGCRSEVPPSDLDARLIDAAERGWSEAGLPAPGRCLADMRVRWATSAQAFRDVCGVTVERAASCLTWRGPLLRPGEPIDGGGDPAIHELMHALYSCTIGRSRSVWDGSRSNVAHDDARVWYQPGTAQGHAREAYRASQ